MLDDNKVTRKGYAVICTVKSIPCFIGIQFMWVFSLGMGCEEVAIYSSLICSCGQTQKSLMPDEMKIWVNVSIVQFQDKFLHVHVSRCEYTVHYITHNWMYRNYITNTSGMYASFLNGKGTKAFSPW